MKSDRIYDSLQSPAVAFDAEIESLQFSPNKAYVQYMRMHKVLLGEKGGEELAGIHHQLREEYMPRYLDAAGWAAIESAVVSTHKPHAERLQLIESGISVWNKAIEHQKQLNTSSSDYLTEWEFPHRMALNIAVAPLLRGIVAGGVSQESLVHVFEDCLQVAQSNAIQIELAANDGYASAVSAHVGLGYECNTLLAANATFSPTQFVIPSFTRAGSGHYYPRQTHDLLSIRQKWGLIKSALPIEVKSAASANDRRRYAALIIRGKMHLSKPGYFKPIETLHDITDWYEDYKELRTRRLSNASRTFIHMAQDYWQGGELNEALPTRTVTSFRSNRVVLQNHPGLSVNIS